MSVRSILTTCANQLLACDRPTAEQIVQKAYDDYADEFSDESERMVLAHARSVAKDIMRGYDNTRSTSEQLTLAGLELPTAIAVPDGEDFYYVRSDRAVWTEIRAGETVRELNVLAAVSKLDSYQETVSQLRPFMEDYPTRTVAQAIEFMNGN